jgi:hypothetical protein
MEVIFIALDRPDDLGKLRSIEATGAWMNEAVLQPKEVLDMLTQRIARYPSKKNGPGPVNPCVIMDTNPPDDDHWYYGLAEIETRRGGASSSSPVGLKITRPRRETTSRSSSPKIRRERDEPPRRFDYYLNMAAGKDENFIKVFLCARVRDTMAGKMVYPEFRDSYHVAKEELKPIPGVRLRLGWDFGLTLPFASSGRCRRQVSS